MHNRMLFRVALVGMFASMLAPAAKRMPFLTTPFRPWGARLPRRTK